MSPPKSSKFVMIGIERNFLGYSVCGFLIPSADATYCRVSDLKTIMAKLWPFVISSCCEHG